MSTAIRRYPEHLRDSVAIRRIHGKTMGLGYWAAIDHRKRGKKHVAQQVANDEQEPHEQQAEEAQSNSS